ncbi:MAG: hypothetical protein HYT89_00905 [Candidatus Omnitrophica bacterium]|nr:hypothetical protein [Candidatus Omnitrophota bacterium]
MEQVHSFHIPVMGTGFTIDTPLKVAPYGISSVISLVDDQLIEKMREHYSRLYWETYVPILSGEEDSRARRITEYLNFIHRVVGRQVEELRQSPFEPGSEISRYFELLDDHSPLKREYRQMLAASGGPDKALLQTRLRERVVAGAIDVNIMTKVDRGGFKNGHKLSREYSDAMAALRGFAKSELDASVVFSAGLNLPLYGYLGEFEDFYPDAEGRLKKRVILKVSDLRSASVQARVLAKKGIWVSECRVESGLNCGGHAFPTEGRLLGPVLEEFKEKKEELVRSLFEIYGRAVKEKKGSGPSHPPAMRLTAQGGVGTAAEHRFLLRYYDLDSVGWGTPFLLVPEATSVDSEMLAKLVKAGEDDIYLSDSSPLGIPFYNLKDSASEESRREKIEEGKPGSPCFNKYLALNVEFDEPLCTASYQYQAKKIKLLREKNLPDPEFEKEYERIVEKSCICRHLGDGALAKHGLEKDKKRLNPAVCPGPNLAYFSRIVSLEEMVGHIYGRARVIGGTVSRPHVLINEMRLYVRFLKEAILKSSSRLTRKEAEYFAEFKKNLTEAVDYYRRLADQILEESEQSRNDFLQHVFILRQELEKITLPCVVAW